MVELALSELSEQVAAAHAAAQPLRIRGGGTRLFYGEPFPESDAARWLDLSGYRGVVAYEPTELVLTARAGTPLAEVEALLDQQGQMLAFEPPRFGPADTFGGAVATGLSGPARMAAGPLSDYVLGARLMGANGKLMHFGGEVMKNVAGYDVSRLLAGSLGVLGPIMEISVKVMPKPRHTISLALALDETTALRESARWRGQPIPVSATAWLRNGSQSGGTLTIRLSGNESAVRAGRSKIGGEVLDAADADAFWKSLRDQTHRFFQQRPLFRVVLPPATAPLETGNELHEWHGCLRWLAGVNDVAELRARARDLGGAATLYRHDAARGAASVFHPLDPAVMKIHQRLKRQLDPDALFNPHRMYPEL